MKELLDVELTERGYIADRRLMNFCGVAYKNILNSLRKTKKMIESGLLSPLTVNDDERSWLVEYREQIVVEIRGVCDEALSLLIEKLYPNHTRYGMIVEQAFSAKMIADYMRYKTEVEPADSNLVDLNISSIHVWYTEALQCLQLTGAPSTDVVRLGTVLNYTVFLHETCKAQAEALYFASKTLKQAEYELENSYRNCLSSSSEVEDIQVIASLIRQNIEIWRAGLQPNENTTDQTLK